MEITDFAPFIQGFCIQQFLPGTLRLCSHITDSGHCVLLKEQSCTFVIPDDVR